MHAARRVYGTVRTVLVPTYEYCTVERRVTCPFAARETLSIEAIEDLNWMHGMHGAMLCYLLVPIPVLQYPWRDRLGLISPVIYSISP
jgi:hypothetical protein